VVGGVWNTLCDGYEFTLEVSESALVGESGGREFTSGPEGVECEWGRSGILLKVVLGVC
jgi:hypothetical protein